MVDHVNKIVLKEIGQGFKSDEQIDSELSNISKWISRQQSGEFKVSIASQRKNYENNRLVGNIPTLLTLKVWLCPTKWRTTQTQQNIVIME